MQLISFCVYSSGDGIGSSDHYTLTEKIIIWASIHLKIVSMNKSENCCFKDARAAAEEVVYGTG